MSTRFYLTFDKKTASWRMTWQLLNEKMQIVKNKNFFISHQQAYQAASFMSNGRATFRGKYKVQK